MLHARKGPNLVASYAFEFIGLFVLWIMFLVGASISTVSITDLLNTLAPNHLHALRTIGMDWDSARDSTNAEFLLPSLPGAGSIGV